MKTLLFLGLILFANHSYPEDAKNLCLKSAKSWVLNSESKKTKTKIELIKDTENNSLGNGANLFLISIFVTGPKTGDNTHWEVVGEFDYAKDSCKILVGRRYWTH